VIHLGWKEAEVEGYLEEDPVVPTGFLENFVGVTFLFVAISA
jgi:hypothetical protein